MRLNVNTLYSMLSIILIISLIQSSTVDSTSVDSIVITIRNDGVVVVEINGTAFIGLNEYKAPAEPILLSLEASINGTQVVAIYVNRTIFVPSTTNGTVYIRYLVNVTTHGNTLSFYVYDVGKNVRLVVEPSVVLLSMPSNIVSMKTSDGLLEIVFRGPTVIKYVIAVNKTAGGTTTAPVSTGEESQGVLPPGINITTLLIATIAAVLAVIAYLLYKKKLIGGSSNVETSFLDSTDKNILRFLKESGGSMLQSELQRRLSLPKATLWRHVYKLAQLGFLEIVKEGRANKLVLKKKI